MFLWLRRQVHEAAGVTGRMTPSESMAVHIGICTQKFMKKFGKSYVFWQSARGLAQSKTLRAVRESLANASRLGVRRPSAAFPQRNDR